MGGVFVLGRSFIFLWVFRLKGLDPSDGILDHSLVVQMRYPNRKKNGGSDQRGVCYASLAEKTLTPPMKFLWRCFYIGGSFPKPPSEREGDRDSGGRRRRDFGVLISFIVTRSPSVAFGASSLPEGAFIRHISADSGFGLLPDIVPA